MWGVVFGWEAVKDYVSARVYVCEGCGHAVPTELHHMLIHRMKGNKKIDCSVNAMYLCRKCHDSGVYNGWEQRVEFYKKQLRRYGSEAVNGWLDGLDLVTKPSFHRYQ